MSQAGILGLNDNILPPDVPTSFVTDNGTAVPAAHILNVPGGTSTDNNTNGVETSGSGNTLTVKLTNRAVGLVKTIGVVTSNLIVFIVPNLKGTYKLQIDIAALEEGTPTGASYQLNGTIVCNGAGAIATAGTPVRIFDGDLAVFNATEVDVVPSGLNINITVTGILGKTIDWAGELNFVFVGVI